VTIVPSRLEPGQDCTPRQAAFVVAVERVASALEKRGIFA